MENTEMEGIIIKWEENDVVGDTKGNKQLIELNSSCPQFPKATSSSYLAPNKNVCNNPSDMRNPSNGSDDQLLHFAEFILGPKFDPNMDPKKINKMISNRLSAQRSRHRKMRYLLNLEEQAKTFQEKVTALRTEITSYTNQKQLLMSEQATLRQKLEAIEKEKSLRNAETEKRNAELKILKELKMKKELEELFGVPIFNYDAIPHPLESCYTNPGQDQLAEKNNGEETSSEIMKLEMAPINHEVVLHYANNMDFLAPNNMTLPNYPAVGFGRHHLRQCHRGWVRHWLAFFVPVPSGQGELSPRAVPLHKGVALVHPQCLILRVRHWCTCSASS
ncbi:hypothetical protein PIB30_066646 [Stylosanthes scabra]|uniref:BZIP domain-containing protein n=1 Tax=Stylosanthes scabra TaxID=79078 RepID=A0ABU6QLT9_9FABA|nr:hypothetical protein [Stylosanthes scabra]